jgi:hypothetical protein
MARLDFDLGDIYDRDGPQVGLDGRLHNPRYTPLRLLIPDSWICFRGGSRLVGDRMRFDQLKRREFTPAAKTMQQANRTVPVIFIAGSDPVVWRGSNEIEAAMAQ